MLWGLRLIRHRGVHRLVKVPLRARRSGVLGFGALALLLSMLPDV